MIDATIIEMSDNLIERTSSPDANAGGLLRDAVDALRYEVPRPLDADEVPGIVAQMIPGWRESSGRRMRGRER